MYLGTHTYRTTIEDEEALLVGCSPYLSTGSPVWLQVVDTLGAISLTATSIN